MFAVCFVPNEWVELYPAKKYDRTQRMGRSLPNEWVRRYPAAGYKTTQPLGIKTHEKGIKTMLIY
ncbi:hypothetical protein F0475_08100 [Prevotella sp. A2879]|uniref:Uncharacterized protein n=1 Tax=Prevotella vespertina TaxID=2608404 RepID=A0A7C9HTN1_9BACT|nr:hypothetical protein [Prevotella vespertina]